MDLCTICKPLAAGVVLLAVSAHVSAQACALGPPHQLGRVTVLPDTCSGGLGTLPRTTCQVLLVECQGIPDIEVEVRTSEPAPGVAIRGTVVFGVGGGGVGFYADRVGGTELFQELLDEGFRIVDRSWRTGWFNDFEGVRRQSCRYATLLTWVHDNIHTTGAFCASGNSGGSGELSYALTTWGRGDILDVAVPTGGPPMARLDFLCLNPPEWQNLCASIVPPEVMSCGQPACTVQPNNQVCISCSGSATLQDLHADSILHPGAVLDFPTTRVHSIVGSGDCGSAVPMAILFSNAITSEKILEFAPATPHWVATTQEGRDAILRALLGGVACLPDPASMTAAAWPSIGGALNLDMNGPPNAAYAVYNSLSTTVVELPGLGWQFIGMPVNPAGSGTLNNQGADVFSASVPNNPSLIDLDVYIQAQIDACLSNLVHIRILP